MRLTELRKLKRCFGSHATSGWGMWRIAIRGSVLLWTVLILLAGGDGRADETDNGDDRGNGNIESAREKKVNEGEEMGKEGWDADEICKSSW